MASHPRPLALVTGASSGIGRELARQFAQNGYDLVITATDRTALDQVSRELAAEAPVQAKIVVADLTSPEEVEALYRQATADRPLDALAANAGVGVGGADFSQTDLAAELKLVDLNVRSQIHLVKLAVQDMVGGGQGKILITSSIASAMPGPFEAVYAASKAFLRSFGEAIRNELSEKGVGVTVLMPGPTDTNFFRRAGMEETPVGQNRKDDPAEVARQGFEALMKDRHHVVAASAKTKVQAAATNLMPDPMLAKVHRRMSEPKADGAAANGSGSGTAMRAGVTLGAIAAVAASAWLWNKRAEGPLEERTRQRLGKPGDMPAPNAADIRIDEQ